MSERDTPAVLAYRVGQLETSVKEGMATLSSQLTELSTNFARKEDLTEIALRVTKLEDKNNLKAILLWTGLVASAIINIVMVAKVFGAV